MGRSVGTKMDSEMCKEFKKSHPNCVGCDGEVQCREVVLQTFDLLRAEQQALCELCERKETCIAYKHDSEMTNEGDDFPMCCPKDWGY